MFQLRSHASSRKQLLLAAGCGLFFLARAVAAPDLHDAAQAGNLAVVTDMIAHGSPVNAGSGSYQFTALMGAASGGHLDVLNFLLAHGAQTAIADKEGSTALLHACWDNQTDTAVALLKAGANPNIGSHYKRFPLMYAASNFNATIVAALIAAKADLEQNSNLGTALLWAANQPKNAAVVHLLLQAGANVNAVDKEDHTALSYAIFGEDTDLFAEVMQAHPNLQLQDKKGSTYLILASRRGTLELSKQLVAAGVDINAVDKAGETALTRAGDVGDSAIVDFLTSKGAQRIDVHIIPRTNPVKELPPAQLWALAVGAVYTQRNNEDHRILGGGDEAARAKKMMKDWWSINNKADLVKQLDDLQQHGHHEQYQLAGMKLAAMTPDEFQNALNQNPDHEFQIQSEKESYVKWKDRSGLAWDLCRSSMLVSAGFAAHYLNEKEAWDRLMPLARETQHSFASWQEMADNFLDGRKVWDSDYTTAIPACAKLLLNPKDPNSPWNTLPWATDLSEGQASE
jgi:ankyrin repeat protein